MHAMSLRNYVRFALVGALVIGLISFAPGKAEARVTSPERQMVKMINNARAASGRAPLKVSGALSNLARRHSRTMASKDRLYHNQKLGRWLARYEWRIAGENVGYGGSLTSLHKAFMASPGHRANNLSKAYKKVGVGVVRKDGRIWITVVFMG